MNIKKVRWLGLVDGFFLFTFRHLYGHIEYLGTEKTYWGAVFTSKESIWAIFIFCQLK